MPWRAIRSSVACLCAVLLTVPASGSAAASPHSHAQVEPRAARELHLAAPGVSPEPLRVRVWLPPGYAADPHHRYPVLYVNDGQDLEAVGLIGTLRRLARDRATRIPIVVAIDAPPDRMSAYGLSDRHARQSVVGISRYGPVGTHADQYSNWLSSTLVPWVDDRYRTLACAQGRAILGWSLGGLNAFDLGWQYPGIFGRVGAFSPSFWLSAERDSPAAVQRSRLALQAVDAGPARPGLRLFLAVGTDEESDDRDGDGVIDVVDDARDLLQGWQPDPGDGQAHGLRGLRQLGYSINADQAQRPSTDDAVLYVLPGGQHRQSSWARMLPAFLRWAFPRADSPVACPQG